MSRAVYSDVRNDSDTGSYSFDTSLPNSTYLNINYIIRDVEDQSLNGYYGILVERLDANGLGTGEFSIVS